MNVMSKKLIVIILSAIVAVIGIRLSRKMKVRKIAGGSHS